MPGKNDIKKRIEELIRQKEELERRLPKHSIPISIIEEIELIEEEISSLKKHLEA